jgi:hypothetical protein
MEQFVKVYNKAETRFIRVDQTRDIDELLSNPHGRFEVELDANQMPVIYDALAVKALCDDRVRGAATASVTRDSGIFAKITAAATAAANAKAGKTTAATKAAAKEEPVAETKATAAKTEK